MRSSSKQSVFKGMTLFARSHLDWSRRAWSFPFAGELASLPRSSVRWGGEFGSWHREEGRHPPGTYSPRNQSESSWGQIRMLIRSELEFVAKKARWKRCPAMRQLRPHSPFSWYIWNDTACSLGSASCHFAFLVTCLPFTTEWIKGLQNSEYMICISFSNILMTWK